MLIIISNQLQASFHQSNYVNIVMEFCVGGDLFTLISAQRGKQLHEELILFIFLQLCLAVNYIHGRHILHRDIKTQNIFITTGFVVKLGDFGIARILDGTSDYAKGNLSKTASKPLFT